MRHLRRVHAVEEQESLKRRPRPRWGLLAVAVALGALLLALDVSVCPLANLTGLPCPGCGLTRASLALVQGDLGAAWRFHPAVFVALPVLGVAFMQAVLPIARPSPGGDRLMAWIAALVLTLMIALWVARFAGAFGGPVPVDGPLRHFTR